MAIRIILSIQFALAAVLFFAEVADELSILSLALIATATVALHLVLIKWTGRVGAVLRVTASFLLVGVIGLLALLSLMSTGLHMNRNETIVAGSGYGYSIGMTKAEVYEKIIADLDDIERINTDLDGRSINQTRRPYKYFNEWHVYGEGSESYNFEFRDGRLFSVRQSFGPFGMLQIGDSQDRVFEAVSSFSRTDRELGLVLSSNVIAFNREYPLYLDSEDLEWEVNFRSSFGDDWLRLQFEDDKLSLMHRFRRFMEPI